MLHVRIATTTNINFQIYYIKVADLVKIATLELLSSQLHKSVMLPNINCKHTYITKDVMSQHTALPSQVDSLVWLKIT